MALDFPRAEELHGDHAAIMTAIALSGRCGGVWHDRLVGSDDGNLNPGRDVMAAERVDGLRAGADDLDQATMATDFLAEGGAWLFDL